jgi:dynein heavy chain
MMLIQDTLENWIKTQRGWMYLEPIFSSEDIQQKMAAEKAKFDKVDKHWKETMDLFSKEKNLWDAGGLEALKNDFATDNEYLDQIQKSLSEYL